MAVAVGDIIRVAAEMLVKGTDQNTNIFNFKVVVNATADDTIFMTDLAAALDVIYGIINPDITDELSYVAISGINLTQAALLPSVPWPFLTVGGSTGNSLPQQVAACVFFRTLTPKVRASKFLGGYVSLANSFGAITAASQALLQLWGDAFVAGIVSGGIDVDYGAFNPTLVRFTPVISAIVPTRWRTQRRRRIGVGS